MYIELKYNKIYFFNLFENIIHKKIVFITEKGWKLGRFRLKQWGSVNSKTQTYFILFSVGYFDMGLNEGFYFLYPLL